MYRRYKTQSIILCPGEISRKFAKNIALDEPVIFHMISSNNQICQDKKHRLEYPYFLLSRENLHRHRCSGIGIERNGSDDESLINPLCLIKEQSLCGN